MTVATVARALQSDRSSDHRDRLRDLVDAHVDDALRPFLTQPDKLSFIPGDIDGAVVFGLAGRVAVAVGDPIGPDRWLAFDRFRRAAARRRITTAVYQSTEASRDQLVARGYRVIPVGREAMIDLAEFTLSGSRRANLRHTISRARRGGVTVEWYPAGLAESPNGLATALDGLDSAWAQRAGPAMGFTITRFRPDALRRNPVAIAFDADRHPVALASFQRSGAGLFVLDLMRRRPGSIPGALEACIAQAATELAGLDATRLSLGLAPLSGLDPESSIPEERWLTTATAMVRDLYDVNGLAFFKGKFDPTWHTRYLAFESRRTFPAVAGALVWLHLGRREQPLSSVVAGIGTAMANNWRAGSPARAEDTSARPEQGGRTAAEGTPLLTRLATVGLGFIGIQVGRWFAARAGRRASVVIVLSVTGLAATIALGSRRSRRLPPTGMPLPPAHTLPRLTVLVSARDEEHVLPELILDLAAQDHRDGAGRSKFNVIVIDDRSSDQTLHRTLDVARKAGIADIVEIRARRGRRLPDGKGAALAFVPPETCEEVVLVLDADARLAPTALRMVAEAMALGVPALALRRGVRNAGLSWLTQAQADEQAVDAAIEEARWALAGTAEFRGNGIAIRRDLLIAAGGWRAVLTEDLDLSARVALATSVAVAWPPEPRVGELPVIDARDLWHQRVRWAEGAIRTHLEWTVPLLRSGHLPVAQRIERALYAAQLLLPFVAAGAAAEGVRLRRPVAAVAIPAAYLAGAVAIGLDALPRVPGSARFSLVTRLGRSIRAALFMSIWMAAVPRAAARIALGRGPLRYRQTPHHLKARQDSRAGNPR